MRDHGSITIPEEARQQAIASIRRYAEENLELEIGDLKAALLLDYFLQEIGPSVYNGAIADAQSFFEERTADLAGVRYQAEFPFWAQRKRSS